MLIVCMQMVKLTMCVRTIEIRGPPSSTVREQFAVSYPFIYKLNNIMPSIQEGKFGDYLIDNREGCYQVVTSNYGLFNVDKRSCNLPTYCREIEFEVTQSNWWANTAGICTGIAGDVVVYSRFNVKYAEGFSNNWWKAYDLRYTPLELNVSGEIHKMASPLETHFALLKQHNLNNYMIYPKFALQQLPMYNSTDQKFTYPPRAQQDGRFCTPRYISDRKDILNGAPSKTLIGALLSVPVPYTFQQSKLVGKISNQDLVEANNSMIWNTRFMYDALRSFSIIYRANQPWLTWHHISHFHSLNCDPYRETTSMLPIQFSYLLASISHIFNVILNWIHDALYIAASSLERALLTINHSYYLYEYILTFIIISLYFKGFYLSLMVLVVLLSYFGIHRY